jgi:hypothetical protein
MNDGNLHPMDDRPDLKERVARLRAAAGEDILLGSLFLKDGDSLAVACVLPEDIATMDPAMRRHLAMHHAVGGIAALVSLADSAEEGAALLGEALRRAFDFAGACARRSEERARHAN